jgi:hypothetical protein
MLGGIQKNVDKGPAGQSTREPQDNISGGPQKDKESNQKVLNSDNKNNNKTLTREFNSAYDFIFH